MHTGIISTVLLFGAFLGMCVVLYWPTRSTKAYKDAEKLALKEEGDDLITPRQKKSHHEGKKP